MARPAPAPFTQQRVECRADRQGHALVIGEEGQRQRHHGVNRPGVQPPVIHGRPHGRMPRRFRAGFHRQRRAVPLAIQVGHRLRHTPEHETNPHARRKQHGEPGKRGKFRFGTLPAQANFTQRQHRQQQAEQYKEIATDHEQPVEMLNRPALGAIQQGVGLFREDQRANHKGKNQYSTDKEDRIVHVHSHDLHIVLADVIVGLVINFHLSSVFRLALRGSVSAFQPVGPDDARKPGWVPL